MDSFEPFESRVARGRKPKRPADSDVLLIESDAEPASGARRDRPREEMPEKPEP